MAEGNGEVTRELKVWQGRSFRVAVFVGVLAIAGSVIALGDRFLTTESEGREIRYELDRHIDWGNAKYEEIIARLDKIDKNQETLIEQNTAIMIELGIHAKTTRRPR